MKKTYLCIHGHFYQPPRENPWIEEIEEQGHVGQGYHDWNERINFECYHPNAFARILDSRERVDDIINNFEFMSFNIGPTLLSWLEKYDPDAYARILQADQNSIKRFGGHGNAIAQGYNHMIMPLANARDKVTQVRWGVEDFKKRFKRLPEAMWLPETACDEKTLEVLTQEGLKFVILSPHQAQKMRKLNTKEWIDVANGSIDPTRAYRHFLGNTPERYIDVFFYDGPISKGVSFDDLVYDAKIYADRLEQAKNPQAPHPQLIHIATDGETYGHHKAFGDRALAYLLKNEAARRGFVITNYGEFLERCPAEYEVRLKEGPDKLGTSWSCFHGVRRWMDHCGCRGGGPGSWHQQWRKPLRDALDWLRDEVAEKIFEEKGSLFFRDVWAARNDYIQIVLDRGPQAQYAFFEKHSKRRLSPQEVVTCLKLMEMQRSSLLMYTSCGWFFTELSGEETVQVIKYAARLVQLAEEVTGQSWAAAFLKRLALAKSNVEYLQDGMGVYMHLVRPSVVTLSRVVNHFALSSLFREYPEKFEIYCYEFERRDYRKEIRKDRTLCSGRVLVRSKITQEEKELAFILLQEERYDFVCAVRELELAGYEKVAADLFAAFGQENVSLREKIQAMFEGEIFTLKDLFQEDRRFILDELSNESIAQFKALYDQLYKNYRRMVEAYQLAQIPLPREYQFVIEDSLSNEFNDQIADCLAKGSEDFERPLEIRLVAKETGLALDVAPSQKLLSNFLNQKVKGLHERWEEGRLKECFLILRMARRLKIDLSWQIAQEYYLLTIDRLANDPEYFQSVRYQALSDFIDLGGQLQLNMDRFHPSLEGLMAQRLL